MARDCPRKRRGLPAVKPSASRQSTSATRTRQSAAEAAPDIAEYAEDDDYALALAYYYDEQAAAESA